MPFRDLVGHRRLLELTAGAAVRGSLPQSLIFDGPEGVGKRAAAVSLAQLLNCATIELQDLSSPHSLVPGTFPEKCQAPDACGGCASCRRIARGVHADVLTIEPGETGAIKVDQVRNAVNRAAYRPFEGRRRMVIFDQADAILVEAQNALLKTLEEPPSASTFVLVTSRPDVLLPTVRSRCQRLRFGRLAVSDIAAALTRDHGYSAADARAAATAADGSIGQALAGGSDERADAREAAAALLQGVSGTADVRDRLESARALTGAGTDRDELARRLRAAASMLRDVSLLAARADETNLANADLKPFLVGLLRWFDGRRALQAFSSVDRALAALERNGSPKIVADWLAFQL